MPTRRHARPGVPAAANPLAEQVYQQLKNDIFSFRLFPGDRFSENGIAQHYGVSRTPMRDGLFRLQREGLSGSRLPARLESRRRSTSINSISYTTCASCWKSRRSSGSARAATIAHAALEALKAVWCVEPALRESDPVKMFGMDENFHRQLVAATGNAEMLRVHNEVTERIRIVRRLDFLKPHRTSATYDEHSTMLNLIERNRLTEAIILLRAHITQSKLEVRKITLSMLAAARDSKLPFVS